MKSKRFITAIFLICIFIISLLAACGGPKDLYAVYNAYGEVVFDNDRREIEIDYNTTYNIPKNFTINGNRITAEVKLFDSDGTELKLSYGTYLFKKVGRYAVKYIYEDGVFEAAIVCIDKVMPVIRIEEYRLYAVVGDEVELPSPTFLDNAGIDESSKSFKVKGPDGQNVAVVDGKFVANQQGNYQIIISVRDINGNETTLTRTVQVLDRYIDVDIEGTNVIYSFNDVNYLNLVADVKEAQNITRSIVSTGYPAIESEPQGNKVLKITSDKVYGDVHTVFLLHRDLLASSGQYITVKFAVSKDTDYIKLYKSAQEMTERGTVAQMFGLKKDTWYELKVNPIAFGYNISFKDFVIMYRDTGGVEMYIDEIRFEEPLFEDDDWSAENLADFDEAEYLHVVYQNVFCDPTTTRAYRVGGTKFELLEQGDTRIPGVNGSDAKAPGLGSSGGVLYGKVTARFGGMTYMFPHTVDLDEVLAITFRMNIPSRYNSLIIGFFDGSGFDGGNNKWFSSPAPEYDLGKWVDFTFSTEHLRLYSNEEGEISGFYMQFLQGETTNWPMEIEFYLDSVIAVLKNEESEQQGEMIADFESMSLVNVFQNGYKNTAEYEIIDASSVGFGDRTGKALKVKSNSHTDGLRYIFDSTVVIDENSTLMFDLALHPDSEFTEITLGAFFLDDRRAEIASINAGEYKGSWKLVSISSSSILNAVSSGELRGIYVQLKNLTNSQYNIAYIDNIRVFSVSGDTEKPTVIEGQQIETFALKDDPNQGKIMFSLLGIKIVDNDPEAGFEITAVKDPDGNDVAFDSEGFVPEVSGEFKLTVIACDRAGNRSEEEEVTLNVILYENMAQYYNMLLSFDKSESLALVTSQKSFSIVDDGDVKGLNINIETPRPARIYLGEAVTISEVESISIRYRVISWEGTNSWARIWINYESIESMNGKGDYVKGFNIKNTTSEYADLVITQAEILNYHSGDDVLKYLTFGYKDGSKSSSLLIDSITVNLKP